MHVNPHKKPSGGHAMPPQPAVPEPRKITYYRGDSHLDPLLVTDRAEGIAKLIDELPNSQLRRFYSDAKGLERQYRQHKENGKSDTDAWALIHPQFAMLKSKVVYAKARPGSSVPGAFVQFVVDHVQAVNEPRDFEAFLIHFEAVVGFHRIYAKKK
jgi:CRISPR-associated protein Csm2